MLNTMGLVNSEHVPTVLELSINSTGVLVGSWLFRMHNFPCPVSFGCMLGVNVEV